MALHESYNTADVIIPGKGTVLVSTADSAEPFDVTNFNIDDKTTIPTGWTPIGFTSKENLPSFEKEGGETTTIDAWETAAVDAFTTDVKRTLSFNLMTFNKGTLQLAYGAEPGSWDDTLKMQWASNAVAQTYKSVAIVFAGGAKRGGIFIARAQLALGDELQLNAEGAIETQLKATVLTPTPAQSAKNQKSIGLLAARPYVSKAGAGKN